MSLARSTALVSALNFLGYVVSLSVHIVFAGVFGAGVHADAWFAAVAVPNFVAIALFASLSKACVPVFVAVREERGGEWFKTLSGVVNLTFVGLGVVAAAVTLSSDFITRMLVPDFDPARLALTRSLLEISIWSVPAVGASMVLAAALQGLRRFGRPATALLAQPIGILLGLVLLRQQVGIASMAFGLVAGSWVQLLILVFSVYVRGGYRPDFRLRDEGVRRILKLLPPLALAAGVISAYLLLEKRFASTITDPAVGPVSWLDYGRRPLNLLVMLFGTSLTITSYTAFAESAARGDREELRSRAWKAAIILALVILPGGIVMGIFAEDVIGIAFQRGLFTAEDTANAAAALRLLLPLTLLAAAGRVLNHAFLALRKVTVPVLTAVAGLAIYAALGPTATKTAGYEGLALLASIGVGLTAILTALALLVVLGRPKGEAILPTLLHMTVAGAASGGLLFLARDLIPPAPTPLLLRILVLGVVSASGLGVYLGILAVFKNPHLAQVLRSLARK
jgi:putative peptidoglycan lipid II flippase